MKGDVIDAAILVHRELGPGLLERIYQECPAEELARRSRKVEREVVFPIRYRGRTLGSTFRLDILVEDSVVIEVESCEAVLPLGAASIASYPISDVSAPSAAPRLRVPVRSRR